MNITEAFSARPLFLMDGAIGTRLEGEYGLTHDPVLALATHVRSDAGRRALAEIWGGYAEVARKHNLPFLANTATRRATRERTRQAGTDESILTDNARFLRSLLDALPGPAYLGGTVGSRGNSYTGDDTMGEDEAQEFHSWSVGGFARAGVDYIYAGIMPNLPEAVGLARACADAGLPSIISFMLRPDGHLVGGASLHDAIAAIDAASDVKPLCYSANCVYPDVIADALSAECNQTPLVRERFLGVMPNASPLPSDALDGCGVVHQSSPETLAESLRKLAEQMTIRIIGGCCGTDERYLDAMVGAVCEAVRDEGRNAHGAL